MLFVKPVVQLFLILYLVFLLVWTIKVWAPSNIQSKDH